jgi:hypothetical protein
MNVESRLKWVFHLAFNWNARGQNLQLPFSVIVRRKLEALQSSPACRATGAGTQVTLSGSGFGSQQGNGVVQLGTGLGSVVSWSDSQVVANVSTGSSSGVAQIVQNNLASNTVAFTVNTATIGNVTPSGGLPGTQVTITGSGFGASQGSGIVWLGTAAGIVTNWSDGQVVATVAAGSNTGNAQVLQNGVWSNSVAFLIDSLQVASITPNSGSAGTVVTITGGGFGNTQGSGNVWIGNAYGVVTGWSDNQIVASVASSAVSGVVKVEQNGAWSNAMAFNVPPSLSGGTQVILAPTQISMLVGDTRSIQALSSSGTEVTGLTWTSSNTAVLTLSTDDPPILTAVAPGNATINVGSASADVTVYSGPAFPTGTTIWSNQGDGSGVSKIIPAVPSSTGLVDVFVLNADYNVQALKSDGTQAWTASVATHSSLIPDFQGGLIVAPTVAQQPPYSLMKLDGMTGNTYPAYNYSSHAVSPVLVHTDSTIFTVDNNAIVAINPLTGQPKFSPITLESGSTSNDGDCGEFQPQNGITGSTVGTPIIAGDGYAYFPYFWSISKLIYGCENNPTSHDEVHARIMRVGSDGSSFEISLGDWVQDLANGHSTGSVPDTPLGTLITNADQGVLYSWLVCFTGGCTQQLTSIANGSASTVTSGINAGSSVPVQPILQRADGSYIGTYTSPMTGGTTTVAFTASGQQLWGGQNDTPQIATSDGDVIGASGTTYDQNGNQTGQLANLPSYSWKNYAYTIGAGSVESVKPLLLGLESSFATLAGGNFSSPGTYVNPNRYPPLPSCTNSVPKGGLPCRWRPDLECLSRFGQAASY